MLKATINIANEMKRPGTTATARLSYTPQDLSLCARELEPQGDVEIELSYSYDGERGLSVDGKLTAIFKEHCARCGREIAVPLECKFSELFIRESDSDIASQDTDSYTFCTDTVDLSDFIDETILLNYPMTSLCDEDCLGLCPICGCDRNETACDCEKEPEDIDLNAEDAFDQAMELLASKYSIKK